MTGEHTTDAGENPQAPVGERADPTTVPPAIETRGLRKTFRVWRREGLAWRRRRLDAVAGIDLDVHAGEIFGFLGPNGAGKTTTIKMLMGLIRPSGGSMRLFGGPPEEIPTRARIGYLPEHPYFYDYLKPAEILDFYARLFRIPKAERRRRVDRLLHLVRLDGARDRRLRTFSKGMLQRIGIATALVNEPDLVVLDEPLSGLDPIGRKEMRDIIVSLRDEGRTVFFSSHILSDIELICDKVAIIESGRLRQIGRLDDLLDQDRVTTEILVSNFGEPEAVRAAHGGVAIERLGAYHRVLVHESGTESALRALLDAGARIEAVSRKRDTLEDLFVKAALGRAPDSEGRRDAGRTEDSAEDGAVQGGGSVG